MKEYISMWQNFANFQGTATVRDYWMAYFINFVIGLVIGTVAGLLPALSFIASLYSLAAFIPGLAISVRRLNDAGHTWKSLLWVLCPLVGWIIVLVRLCKKSAY